MGTSDEATEFAEQNKLEEPEEETERERLSRNWCLGERFKWGCVF